MFSYRSILKQAWNIAWGHKYLWLFGLFASIAIASGSFEHQMLITNFQSGALEGSYYHLSIIVTVLQALGMFLIGLVRLFSYDFITIINTLTVLIITLAIIIAFIWLAVSSQGALVASAKKLITAKKKPSILSLRENLTEGHNHFWPILWLNVLVKVLIVMLLAIVSLPLVSLAAKSADLLVALYTIAFIVFIPLAVGLSLMIKYAIAYIVLDKEDISSALGKSWQLLTKNWLISLEMGLILFLISFVVGFILIFLLSALVFPYFVFAANYGIGWLIVLLAFLALTLILFASALLATFQISAWTSLFLELKGGRGEAKLERMFKQKKTSKR